MNDPHPHYGLVFRGFNRTTPQHRAELVVVLAAMQAIDGRGDGRGNYRIAPGIVRYCSGVLAPYVAAYRRSQRTWEGLRAFEEEEGDWRKPYVAGSGPEMLRNRLNEMSRFWMAA